MRLRMLVLLALLLPWSSCPGRHEAFASRTVTTYTLSCVTSWSYFTDYQEGVTYLDAVIGSKVYRVDINAAVRMTCRDDERWAFDCYRVGLLPADIPRFLILGYDSRRLRIGQEMNFTDAQGQVFFTRITSLNGTTGAQMVEIDPR